MIPFLQRGASDLEETLVRASDKLRRDQRRGANRHNNGTRRAGLVVLVHAGADEMRRHAMAVQNDGGTLALVALQARAVSEGYRPIEGDAGAGPAAASVGAVGVQPHLRMVVAAHHVVDDGMVHAGPTGIWPDVRILEAMCLKVEGRSTPRELGSRTY